MADLVNAGEFEEFLGEVDLDPEVIDPLLEEVEARFESECRRSHRPFRAEQTDRVEDHDGTKSCELWLDYPIAEVTKVEIGTDPSNLGLDLDTSVVATVTVETAGDRRTIVLSGTRTILYTIGGRRLKRIDGGKFGPEPVQVTYDTESDLPDDVAGVLKREAARIYRLRGTEDEAVTRTGGYSGDLALKPGSDWDTAVSLHKDVMV